MGVDAHRLIAGDLAREIDVMRAMNATFARVHRESSFVLVGVELWSTLWTDAHGLADTMSSVSLLSDVLCGSDRNLAIKYTAFQACTTNEAIRASAHTTWFEAGMVALLKIANYIVQRARTAAISRELRHIPLPEDAVNVLSKATSVAARSTLLTDYLSRSGTEPMHMDSLRTLGFDPTACRVTPFMSLIRCHSHDSGYRPMAMLAIVVAVRMRVLLAALVSLGLVQVAESVVADCPYIPLWFPPSESAAALIASPERFELFVACMGPSS